MSIFYSDPKNDGGGKSAKNDISLAEVCGIGGLVLVAVCWTQASRIEAFYIRNFQMIWMTGYLVLLALLFLALRWFMRKNRVLLDDALTHEHLAKHHDSKTIHVGSCDGTPLGLTRKQRLGHVQIIGTTGRGKTESLILPWIVRDARNGVSSLVIDGKGDPELASRVRCALWGVAAVRTFDLGNPSKSATINPLATGTAQAIVDRIFASFDFPDPFYKGVQYDSALALVSALKAAEPTKAVTFRRLHAVLVSDIELAKLAKACPDARLKERLQRMLAQSRQVREANHMGLVSQLAPFAEGEVSELVNGFTGDDVIEMEDSLCPAHSTEHRAPHVNIILLPTLKYQIVAKQLGRMILQDLAGCVGERAGRMGSQASFYSVFMDEFSAFAYEGFEQILNKARSSKVALHLSHQSTADLSMVSPDFARIVNTNTNVKCLLGLNDPDTADFYARHIGTRASERRTERVEDLGWMNSNARTGQASVRSVEEYKIHPNELKNFTHGRGVLHLPTPDGNFTARVQFSRLSPKESVSE